MAVSIDEGGGGKRGRKRLDGELNLVPYIDLLTCMVAFLLITAVWTQLARLQVRQRGQGGADSEVVDHPLRLSVVVHADGFSVVAESDQRPIPNGAGGARDYAALATELRAVKHRFPDATDIQIASEDGIAFDTLVATMDTALAAGFPGLALVDAASGAI
jgi:biopolymer transport protein TolR